MTDTPPSKKILTRDDIFLLGNVTRKDKNYVVNVHAVPKSAETAEIVRQVNEEGLDYRATDLYEMTKNYATQDGDNLIICPEYESWAYVAWDQNDVTQTAWVRSITKSNNGKADFGALNRPCSIRYALQTDDDLFHANALPVLKNDEGLNIKYSHFDFSKLAEPSYAMKSVHVKTDRNRLHWVQFGKKDHPTFGVNKITYADTLVPVGFERLPTEDDQTIQNVEIAFADATSLKKKLTHYGRSVSDMCALMRIPDVTQFMQQPKILTDINDLSLDALHGEFIPQLSVTYERLGTRFEL